MKKPMGRKPKIPQKIHEFDFVKAAKSESCAYVRVKLLALEQIKQGKPYLEVAKFFQVDDNSVRTWVKLVADSGLDSLKVKPGRGRKRLLPESKNHDFKQAILELQAQRRGGRINVSDITKMAQEKFGAEYKTKGMYSLLHKIGMVWISARSVHPASCAAKQETFKKTL